MELQINILSDFVKNATILFNKGLDSVPQFARKSGLFREIPVPKNTGNTREFTEIDLEEYASRKGEDDQAERAKVQQGYSKTGTLYRIAKDIGISYEMRSQGKYLEIQQKLTNLGKLPANRMDLDLTHRLTFGTATSYTDQDGVSISISVGDTLSLFNTSHTVKGASTTFRNILANNPKVSRGALEAMEQMRVENAINQYGQKMTIKDDIIWCGDNPNTINTINELIKSTSNPTQNNPNVANSYNGKYKLAVLPRLATDKDGNVDTTKRDYWGLASSNMTTAYLGVSEEPRLKTPPVEGKNNEEFSTDSFNFGTRAGYMVVIVSANWILTSKGNGDA